MKQKKEQWLRLCNRMLSGLLPLLGFTACDSVGIGNEITECMYGQPYASYELKGKVQDEANRPLPGKRVIIKELDKEGKVWNRVADTLKTDETGNYLHKNNFTNYGRFRIVCQDPDGVYRADSTDVQMTPTGGDGSWYEGADSKVVDFTLKEEKGEE